MDYRGPKNYKKPRRRTRVNRSNSQPEQLEHGIPVYGWGCAPAYLFTRRQLHQLGLSPAQGIAAELRWRKGERYAYLYDRTKARHKKPATPRQLAALAKAMQARRTCARCQSEQDYLIPTSLGCCIDCWNHTSYGQHHPIDHAA